MCVRPRLMDSSRLPSKRKPQIKPALQVLHGHHFPPRVSMSQKLRSLRESAAGSRFFERLSDGPARPWAAAAAAAASGLPAAAVKDGPDTTMSGLQASFVKVLSVVWVAECLFLKHHHVTPSDWYGRQTMQQRPTDST